jgi:ATP-binding protein involved in chromosome partitioning
MDPRLAVIGARLRETRRIVAVTGGKGGIGKSLVACTLAVALERRGLRIGLLDLDLTGPCDHLVLGVELARPREEAGLVPHAAHGVRFMSIAHFAGERPLALRGSDVSNALIELLAITRWGELDLLVIDMPPGLSDAALDAARLLGRAEHLVLATGSPVVVATVRRTLGLLAQLRARTLGVLENMRRGDGSSAVRALAERAGVAFVGALPFDEGVEGALGDPARLARTAVGRGLGEIALRLGLA